MVLGRVEPACIRREKETLSKFCPQILAPAELVFVPLQSPYFNMIIAFILIYTDILTDFMALMIWHLSFSKCEILF